MATLKDISMRLKSVKNIQKITKSMKMIAAVKYARAERELRPARSFGQGAQAFYSRVDLNDAEKKPDHVIIAISSDRGLCGAIHSQLSKHIRHEMAHKSPDKNIRIAIVGDKVRLQLQKQFKDEILFTCNEYGKAPPTFEDATKVARQLVDSGFNFNQGEILYNYFKSVVSYKPSQLPIYSLATVNTAPKLTVYDSLDEETVQSYLEFSLASLIYYAMKEGATSEQSSRMTAMDAASKNAGEMIDKLTMAFNRTRQAVITRELIEIISGAAAV